MYDRRRFLRIGAAASVAGATGISGVLNTAKASDAGHELASGGMDFSPRTHTQRKAVPSACWQCTTRCSIIGYVEDGRLVKIEGQPAAIRNRGRICAKGQGGVGQDNDPDRILYPLRRVGKRGEGKWKRVSWDEALGELAERLKKLRDAGTPEKFVFHYGRLKGGCNKLIKGAFMSTYGSSSIGNHTSICEGGKWVAQELTWGKHYDNWDAERTRYVLNFGSNVFEAHTNHVPVATRLAEAIGSGRARMVTFDVRLSNTAARSSEWLPVRPGTDLAVVLAMCNVIMREDLYKGEGEAFLEFVKATRNPNASTAEKIAALKEHLAQYTPEWAEEVSGVDAYAIARIAREFATVKPAVVISYRGAVAHYYGSETERAIQMLAAITGNIDNPGGRCKSVGAKWKYPKGPKNKPKAKKLKIFDGFKGQVAFPNHHVSNQVFNMIRDGSAGRPEVYMWYGYQPIYSNADCKANREVLMDETMIPFTVSTSPFYDESTEVADLVLPDTTYLERWDWEDNSSPDQVPEFYFRQPMVEPMGEVRDAADVFCELAERIGMPLGFSTQEEFVRLSCEMTPEIKAAGGFDYMRKVGVWHDPNAKPKFYSYMKEVPAEKLTGEKVLFDPDTGVYWDWSKSEAESEEEARSTGYTNTKHAYKGYIGQRVGGRVVAGFKPDKVNKSGYFELYSNLMEDKGFAPLPTYEAIPEHATMAEDDLILTTYKVNVQSHSRTQNCKWLTEIYHDNPAWINPETAARRGIADKDRIKVTSAVGEIETVARVTPAVVPGVIAVSMHCGHWAYGRYASGKRSPFGVDQLDDKWIWWKTHGEHPNWLIPNSPDPISGEQRWMDTVVRVQKVA